MDVDTRKLMDALTLARGLMADERTTFKRGYSLENAALAAIDHYGLNAEEAGSLRRMLTAAQGDEELLRRQYGPGFKFPA